MPDSDLMDSKVIDTLGGVEIINTCPLEDWRFDRAGHGSDGRRNYERFTLDVGVHEMDSDLALWYVRSRRSTNDADRTRRQQQLLSAMLSNGVDAGLITELPSLWAVYRDEIETDLIRRRCCGWRLMRAPFARMDCAIFRSIRRLSQAICCRRRINGFRCCVGMTLHLYWVN